MGDYDITDRNRVRQIREYARYDSDSVHEVLDAGLVGHDAPKPRERLRA